MTMTPDIRFARPSFHDQANSAQEGRTSRYLTVILGLCVLVAAFGVAIAPAHGWTPAMMLLKTCFVAVLCFTGLALSFSSRKG